jgi:hypothetical protein
VLQAIVKVKPLKDSTRAPEKPAAPWGLTPWEQEELAKASRPEMPPPPPQKTPIDLVRNALKAPRELLPLVEKCFPTAKPDDWSVAADSDVKLVTQEVPSGLGKLAAMPAYPGQTKDLDRARAWLQVVGGKFPGFPEVSKARHELLERRIAIRVGESPKPSPDDWKLIIEWEELHKDRSAQAGAGDELLVKAWRVECAIVLDKEAASARDRLAPIRGELLKADPTYGRYLWCRAQRALPEPGWDAIVRELNDLLPALQGPEPILAAQDRVGAVVGLIREAAQERREEARPWAKLDQIPFNSFGSQAEADQYAKLLKAARKFTGEDHEWKLSLALAAFHESKPEVGLTRELLSLQEAKGPDLLPLLFAGVSSFWQQPRAASLPADDPQFAAAIRATTQLLQEFSKDEAGKITKEGAAAVYKSVLQPVLEGAEFQAPAAAKKAGGSELLSDLHGAIAKFLQGQKEAEWPFPKTMPLPLQVIEEQATLAIELHPKDKPNRAKLAEYHATRGGARSFKPDVKTDAVLADVELALKYQPKLHTALAVQAYALMIRAGERPTRAEILADLGDSIKAGDEAVKNCPNTNKAYPIYLLNLGTAHLTLGNYETDADAKKQHFDAARKYAGDAAKLEHAYGEDALLLLGNIHEDLASQVGEKPKENYLEATKRFSQVVEKNPLSAQALCSLARSNYKALVRTRLSPGDLGFASLEAGLKDCKDYLERAVGCSVQDAVRIEAYCHLGKVYEEQANWTKADENLGKAVDLAKQLGASSRAAYFSHWAILPASHAGRLLASRPPEDPEIRKLLDTARQRAELLQQMPAGAFVVPIKQMARIQGLAFALEKKYDQAVKAYDRALPKDLAQADALDVSLLLGRAACNIALKRADAALQDASRALAITAAPSEQADAHYHVAQAHYLSSSSEGEKAAQHRDEFLKSIREAVRLAPEGRNGIAYRSNGATWIALIAVPLAQTDKEQAIQLLKDAETWLEEAKKWLQEAHGSAQETGDITRRLELVGKLRRQLQGPPPSAPPAE